MRDAADHPRYSGVAITLHWLIAAAILLNLGVGWWMSDAINDPETQATAYEAFQFHKSLGLTILTLAVIRLIWRLTHRFPPLPPHMPHWQQAAARFSHVLLYTFMLVMPLTGWIYASTGWNSETGMAFDVPTMWFGLFQWPHVPGVSGSEGIANGAVATHELLAWGFVVLLAVHVLAALKHHFADRDLVLWSMLPIVGRPTASRTTDGSRTAQK
jgi:cytochrome b561